MKYPYFSNWVVYKKIPGEDLYHVKNLVLDSECYLSLEDLMFSLRLNGRQNPYSIKGERSRYQTKLLLQKLQQYDVIRTDHGILKNDGGYLISLIKLRNTKSKRLASIIANTILMFTFIPVLVIGLYMCFHPNSVNAGPNLITGFIYDHWYFISIVAIVFGIFGGAFIHEVAHANAARSTRSGRVFEYGMMLSFPPGFYTLMDFREKSTIKAFQIYAAGCEGNLFFAGGLLILGSFICQPLQTFLIEAAAINIFTVCVNLTPFSGTDGSKILAIVLGLEVDDFDITKRLIKNRRYRRNLVNAGITGCVKLAACYILWLLRMFFPLLILLNISIWIEALL